MRDSLPASEDVTAELLHLRNRVSELEQDQFKLGHRIWLFERAQELAGLGVFSWDLAANVVTWSEEAHRIFGVRPDEERLTYETYLARVAPEDLARVNALVTESATTRQPLRYDCGAISLDGRRMQIRVRADWMVAPHSQAVFLIGTVQDITIAAATQAELQTFQALSQNAPDGIVIVSGTTIRYANAAYRELVGYGDDILGMAWSAHFNEDAQKLEAAVSHTRQHGGWRGPLSLRRKSGEVLSCQLSLMVVSSPYDQTFHIAAIVRDISSEQQKEKERLALQEQVIATQRAALAEMSTPLIPLADGVLVMPLIGTMDTLRAQQVLTTLLDGVSSLRARTVILDITGIPWVDTNIAGSLLQAQRAVSLLGAEIVLTGISPRVAQTLVSMGADLSQVTTRSTLQSGIAYALSHQQRSR